jgi:hypothetical protein
MNLISSSTRRENVERYEVRSITNEPPTHESESLECAIGPEFYSLFKDEKDVRTIVEALVDAEVKVGNFKVEDRQRLMEDISRTIVEDRNRRGHLLIYYAVYFIVGFYFLSDNYAKGDAFASVPLLEDPISQLILNTLPLLTAFYLHMIYVERVRTGSFIHILPLAILLNVFLINQVIRNGRVTEMMRSVLIISSIAAVVVTFYLIRSLRSTYNECIQRQLNKTTNTGSLILVAIFGILLPLVLQGCTYLALPSSTS